MSTSTDCFFYFLTNRGDVIKIVAEILKNTQAGQCFCTITNEGIRFSNQDASRSLISNQYLEADKFFKYVFRGGQKPYTIGLNTQNFYRMIKASKKRQAMSCAIENMDDKKMLLNVNGVDTVIQIQRNQPILPEIPEGYEEVPCIAPSTEFHTMCKELALANSKYVRVTQKENGSIRFEIDNTSYGKSVNLGSRILISAKDKKWRKISQTFTLKTFTRLQKIASVSNIVKLRWQKHLPLCIGYQIEPLGYGEIYIESDELIKRKLAHANEKVHSDEEEESDLELE